MTYTAGSMDRQQLMDEFGLNAEGLASSNTGSSTGVKSNPLLGTGYLTDDDTQRLLNNENLKNAFIEMKGGQTAAESSESPWGSLVGETNSWETVNDVDSVLDWLSKEPPKEEPAPVVFDISPTHVDVDVAENPAVKKPIAGVDYPTGPVNDAIERIRAHNQATHDFTAGAEPNMIQGMEGFVKQSPNPSTDFNAADWIAKTSRPDTDQQDHAQKLADTYKFEIAKNLQPDPQSVVNALTTAIPNTLGVYS